MDTNTHTNTNMKTNTKSNRNADLWNVDEDISADININRNTYLRVHVCLIVSSLKVYTTFIYLMQYPISVWSVR